jgi:chromosome segregation ATPase
VKQSGLESQFSSAAVKQSEHESQLPSAAVKQSELESQLSSAAVKQSELQSQLSSLQEELSKTKDQLILVENEKNKALEELHQSKNETEEANEKLRVALLDQKKSEEANEIEKARTIELEQSSHEHAKKREKEWRRKYEEIKSQQEIDKVSMVETTKELENVKQDLLRVLDAKNMAISHAEDSEKIAEVNIEKVLILTREIERIQEAFDKDLMKKEKEKEEMKNELDNEILMLKGEVQKGRGTEQRLVEFEILIQVLKDELSNLKNSEEDLKKVLNEWREKAEFLQIKLDESEEFNKLKEESFNLAIRDLEQKTALLREREVEASLLRDKIGSLEVELDKYKGENDISSQTLLEVEKEALALRSQLGDLKLKFQTLEEAKTEAIEKEKDAAVRIEGISRERNELFEELQVSKDELEKVKKAMDDLASALHEVSAEAREAREKFLNRSEELDKARSEIEELNLNLKNTKESYEVMLDEANYERVCLQKTVEKLEKETRGSNDEWYEEETRFMELVQKSEEEIVKIKLERDEAAESLKETQSKLDIKRGENEKLQSEYREVEIKINGLEEALVESQEENASLKKKLMEKERETEMIANDNEDRQNQEALGGKSEEHENGNKNDNSKVEENGKGHLEEEGVMVVSKIWDSWNGKEENGLDGDDLDSNLDDNASEKATETTENGKKTDPQKKKTLFKKVGGFLKKKGSN